jgi:hypothetical protein
MAIIKPEPIESVLEPSVREFRRLFRASAHALMENRPLREVTAPAATPSAALSKAELDALAEAGLSTSPWVGEGPRDPLVETIVDYMALIETSLSTAVVAAMLEVDVSRIRQRIRNRSLLGIEYEGEWRLPRFQFERKRVLPGLAEVLAALPAELNPLDVATWFLEPNIDLETEAGRAPLSPRAWLLRGRAPDAVTQLAQHV